MSMLAENGEGGRGEGKKDGGGGSGDGRDEGSSLSNWSEGL